MLIYFIFVFNQIYYIGIDFTHVNKLFYIVFFILLNVKRINNDMDSH